MQLPILHAVLHPDLARGFNIKTKYHDALTGEEREKEYTAAFKQSLVANLFSSLDNVSSNSEALNYDSILAAVKDGCQVSENIGKIGDADLKDKITKFVTAIKDVVREKIDANWKFDDTEITDEVLEFYKVVWNLDDGEDLDTLSVYEAFMQYQFQQIEWGEGDDEKYNIWKKLEAEINLQSFYANREKKDFVLMAQIFVTSLTAFYNQENSLKIDFADFMQREENFPIFINKIKECYKDSKSFISIVDEVINPALESRGLKKIDSSAAEQYFRENVFFSIYGSPHYDEFFLIPNKQVDNARINFCSFGGAISCSIDELGIDQFEYRKFEYENPSIGHINEVGSFERTIDLQNLILPQKEEDLARFLALQGAGDNANKRVYNLLNEKLLAKIKLKDLALVFKHINPYLSDEEKIEFKNKFGINKSFILTPEKVDKIYNLFLMYSKNEWPGFDYSARSGNANISQMNGQWISHEESDGSRKLGYILSYLVDHSSSKAPAVKFDNGKYYVEYEKEPTGSITFLNLMTEHDDTECFVEANLAEACYGDIDVMYPELEINQYNNTGPIRLDSKFIQALQALYPELNIKPNIPPYSEMYDREMVLVDNAKKSGYILRCQNTDTLRGIYQRLDLDRQEKFKVELPDWMARIWYDSSSGHDFDSYLGRLYMRDYITTFNQQTNTYTVYLNREYRSSIFESVLDRSSHFLKAFNRYNTDIQIDTNLEVLDADFSGIQEWDQFIKKFEEIRTAVNTRLVNFVQPLITDFTNDYVNMSQQEIDNASKILMLKNYYERESKEYFKPFLDLFSANTVKLHQIMNIATIESKLSSLNYMMDRVEKYRSIWDFNGLERILNEFVENRTNIISTKQIEKLVALIGRYERARYSLKPSAPKISFNPTTGFVMSGEIVQQPQQIQVPEEDNHNLQQVENGDPEPENPVRADYERYAKYIALGIFGGALSGASLISAIGIYNANISEMTIEVLASTAMSSITSDTGVFVIISGAVIGCILSCVNEGLIAVPGLSQVARD